MLGRASYESRRRTGMTQRELAEMCGVRQSTISRLERGALNGMRLKRLATVIAALDFVASDRP